MPATTRHYKIYWADGTSEELTMPLPGAATTDDEKRLIFTDSSGKKQEINKAQTKRIESWDT